MEKPCSVSPDHMRSHAVTCGKMPATVTLSERDRTQGRIQPVRSGVDISVIFGIQVS